MLQVALGLRISVSMQASLFCVFLCLYKLNGSLKTAELNDCCIVFLSWDFLQSLQFVIKGIERCLNMRESVLQVFLEQ